MRAQRRRGLPRSSNMAVPATTMPSLAELKPFLRLSDDLNLLILGCCLVLFVFPFVVIFLAKRHGATKLLPPSGRRLSLPPGPPRLPLVGNLHQVGRLPHRSLWRLAEKYGPLMYLKLGQVPTLVVSSPAVAAEVLKTQDHLFCTRPPLSAVRDIFYGGMDVAFTPYNGYWRQMRRLCTQELFTARRVELFRRLRQEEVATLVGTIRRAAAATSSPVNLSDMLLCLLNNITCREVFGRRFAAAEGDCRRSHFHELVTEWTSLMGHFNVGEYFPSMEWLNVLTGLRGRFQRCFLEMDAFLDDTIDAHQRRGQQKDELHHEYLVSVLLRCLEDPNSSLAIPITREHVKAVLMDVFIAGTDTGTLALEWGMAELVRNPMVMKKAREEVRRVVGEAEEVEECHVHKLEYLKLVVKEILRLHPPGPFLLPRESRRACKVAGFDVPANTRVTINVWAIGRDPAAWEDPDAFLPERFEGSALGVDYKGQHFQLLPFGAGRRGCPGVALGSAVVALALANLLHCFEWETPDGTRGEDVDMEEDFGIVIRKKRPLLLRAIPRKPSKVHG